MQKPTVTKQSGQSEPFTVQKIVSSIVKAGGTVELAQDIAEAVAQKIRGSDEDHVESLDIRRLVKEKLGKQEPAIAKSYAAYKKT